MERCAKCRKGKPLAGSIDERITVGDATFVAALPALVCPECSESYVDAETLERFELTVCDWLTNKGHRVPAAVRFIRKALGMRAADLGELVEVTPETVSRWENDKLAVPLGVFAILGELVADRIEGRDATLQRLRALRSPAHHPKRAVRLNVRRRQERAARPRGPATQRLESATSRK